MLCQSLSNYQSIEFITKLLSRRRQQQKCFPKTEWRKVKTEKKEILHFIASSMVDVETMFKLSIVLWEKAKHNTTTTLTSTSCPSDNQTKSENLLFWTVIMVMRRGPSLFLWDDSTLGNESDPHGDGGDSSAERCCYGNNCSLYFLHIRNVRS